MEPSLDVFSFFSSAKITSKLILPKVGVLQQLEDANLELFTRTDDNTVAFGAILDRISATGFAEVFLGECNRAIDSIQLCIISRLETSIFTTAIG